MRVLLQRVTHGRVTVGDEQTGRIGHGLVLLVGVGEGDGQAEIDKLAGKIVGLRVFPDAAGQGKFDRSLMEVGGAALVVSQFTLYADCRKGRRPSFSSAARPELAEPLCEAFADKLRELGVAHVATGRFGAMMHVEIHNDGPVTIWLDSADMM